MKNIVEQDPIKLKWISRKSHVDKHDSQIHKRVYVLIVLIPLAAMAALVFWALSETQAYFYGKPPIETLALLQSNLASAFENL